MQTLELQRWMEVSRLVWAKEELREFDRIEGWAQVRGSSLFPFVLAAGLVAVGAE
jgi:hypothetical protein